MSNLNKVQLIGRITRDPELKYTKSGTALCKLGMATNSYRRGPDGESMEQVEFHNMVCFDSEHGRKLATLAAEYLKKGSLAYVEGRLQTHSWEADDGSKRSSTEVILNDIQFLSPKSETNKAQPTEDPDDVRQDSYPGHPSSAPAEKEDEEIDPDDIPF